MNIENLICFAVCLIMIVAMIMYFIHDYYKNIKK